MDDDLIAAMGAAAHGYFAGGAGDEHTLRWNDEAWSRVRLLPKVLVDVSDRDTSVMVLGRRLAHPVIVAPMAYQKHAHPDGELGTARAAAATNAAYVLSSQTTTSPADIATEVPDLDRWFQLYVFRDRQVSLDLVAEARESGFSTLVVTVDFPVGGWRDRDRASGFVVEHPVALNRAGPAMTTAELFAQHDPGLTWDDIAEFAEAAGMPLVVKGILREDDTVRALDVGAQGIVVSNHGGRQLDTVAPTSERIESIAEVVDGRASVLVDGGIRRGWDVAKALALGADAVMVGRPVLWGLARGGTDGATAVLKQLVDELDNTLALLGCPRAEGLDGSYLDRGPTSV